MNVRDRIKAVLNFQHADRLPCVEWASWWDLTIKRWLGEGLPAGMNGVWLGSSCPAMVWILHRAYSPAEILRRPHSFDHGGIRPIP